MIGEREGVCWCAGSISSCLSGYAYVRVYYNCHDPFIAGRRVGISYGTSFSTMLNYISVAELRAWVTRHWPSLLMKSCRTCFNLAFFANCTSCIRECYFLFHSCCSFLEFVFFSSNPNPDPYPWRLNIEIYAHLSTLNYIGHIFVCSCEWRLI